MNEIDEKVLAWSKLTIKEYPEVVFYFLFSTKEDRHFIMKLMKRAGIDFKEKYLKDSIGSGAKQLFYDIYSKDYQRYDAEVRFSDNELDQIWAMFIKMNALGMTYEEIIKDSERRDAWTPLEQKGKGRY